ncbi:hypothetical protein V2J09_005687 [Rumex salicifolius]
MSLFKELGYMYCDNIGAASLSSNPVFHSRTIGILLVSYVSTLDQLVNILTKPLHRPRFEFLASKLNLAQSSFNLRECNSNNII